MLQYPSNFNIKAYMAAQTGWVASVSNSGDRCLEMYNGDILIHFLRLYSYENEAEGVFEKHTVVGRTWNGTQFINFSDNDARILWNTIMISDVAVEEHEFNRRAEAHACHTPYDTVFTPFLSIKQQMQ